MPPVGDSIRPVLETKSDLPSAAQSIDSGLAHPRTSILAWISPVSERISMPPWGSVPVIAMRERSGETVQLTVLLMLCLSMRGMTRKSGWRVPDAAVIVPEYFRHLVVFSIGAS